jgi:hypothetical protein
MASVTSTLSTLADLAAEKAAWGQLDWTVTDTRTNATTTAVVAAVGALQNAPPVTHFLDYLVLSYNSAPTSVGVLTVHDGTANIFTVNIPLNVPNPLIFDFRKPLRSQPGAALTVNLSASGAAISTVQLNGHSTRTVTAF